MSFLGAGTSGVNANRRAVTQSPVASNILGTPWPTLWGMRDLKGTVIAWTNHRFSNSGASGKGGGQVSSGEKDYRTFALGLCIGAVDRIIQIWYDNELIWSGNVGIASAATLASATVGVGGVVLTDSRQRGTITFYFGVENQTQDPVLKQFIPDVPFYRGMCYAVFHGPRTGTRGFRLGNADTLAQIALRVERIPSAPFQLPFAATVQDNPGNVENELQPITLTTDLTGFTGAQDMAYSLLARNGPSNSQLNIGWAVQSGVDSLTTGTATITNGTPFALGSLGLMVTLSWGSNTSPPLETVLVDIWNIFLASGAGSVGGANPAAMLYEALISPLHGVALDVVLIDIPAFQTAALALPQMGLSYAVEEKGAASQLIEDILKNVQGALTISNGLLGLRLLTGGTVVLTLQPDDVTGLRVRPGSWYEVPAHAQVKYADVNRKYHDTILPLPGAGDFGNDEKQVEITLPMVTDAGVARLIGSRLRTLEALPKNPDTLSCGRGVFQLQFGDVILVNDAARGFDPTLPLIIVAIREHGAGNETIELDVVPDMFGPLPIIPDVVGGTNDDGSGGSAVTPINPIALQELVELPWDFAQDGSKQFTLFAARPDPDVEGMALYASTENPPVDYNLADSSAPLHVGGTVIDANLSRFTMDREAYIDFEAASDDIDLFSSLSDSDWFGYQMLVLVGSGINAGLYAVKELILLSAGNWRLQGIFGPLSDTPVPTLNPGDPLFVFVVQPLFQLAALPAWVINSLLTFKPIPLGSRPSPTLSQATASGLTILSRALRPFPADNLVANGRGASMTPLYSADIALAWTLRNRGFGFGYETNPSEFDPAVASEVASCDVEIWVGGVLKRTDTAAIRSGEVSTSIASVTSSLQFTVGSVAGLQVGDRIGIVHGTDDPYFARIQSISGLVITLFSALPFLPTTSDAVNRYESIGYIYTSAYNVSDNGSLAAVVDVKIYPTLNGLRALRPAEILVTKQ